MTLTVVIIILQLVFLEGILSIDNAAVMGTMVAELPNDIPAPWPKSLTKIGKKLHPILGNQQTAALRIGLLGAYVGRGLMLFLATLIIQNPWIKIVGAIYLIYLAFDNLGLEINHNQEENLLKHNSNTGSFWSIVISLNIADMIFSLDNVVAAVAISDQLWVVVLGVAIGMLLIRFAAGVFIKSIKKEPVLQKAAFLLILNIGIEIILEEFGLFHFADWMKFTISISTIAIALLYAHSKFMQQAFLPIILWARHGFYHFKIILEWGFEPFMVAGNKISMWVKGTHIKKPSNLQQTPPQFAYNSNQVIPHNSAHINN